jgi:hypothetical protein
MPWYECPRCGSNSAFFQNKQEFTNGFETYVDRSGDWSVRRTLDVDDVRVPFCRECPMPVQMDSYLTEQEILRRKMKRIAIGIFVLACSLTIFYAATNSDSSANSQSSASEFVEDRDSSTYPNDAVDSLYLNDNYGRYGLEVNRDMTSIGIDTCGNKLSDSLINMDFLVPAGWRFYDGNGCGSGATYTWISNKNEDFILFGASASAGWCSELTPDQYEDAVYEKLFSSESNILTFENRPETFIYDYQYINAYGETITGLYQNGYLGEFCGNGDSDISTNMSSLDIFNSIVEKYLES